MSPTTGITIERATAADAEAIAPLFDGYRQFYGKATDIRAAEAFLAERLSRAESVVFLARAGGEAVGFTQLYPTFSSVSLRPLWILNDLFVAPDARGAGVAEALLERARALALETGAKGLMLETDLANIRARRLYERLGWVKDDTFCVYNLTF